MILSQNSGYPEQLISLPNPNLSEPRVTMETRKLIFKPEADVNTRIRDEKNTLEKPNIDGKVMVPLSLEGTGAIRRYLVLVPQEGTGATRRHPLHRNNSSFKPLATCRDLLRALGH